MENNQKIKIISREEWGARPQKGRYSKHSPEKLILHHTAVPNKSDFSGEKTIRAIQNYHMDVKGWSDIGYHWILDPFAEKAYEGRPMWAIGAHCGAPTKNAKVNFTNLGTCGICLVGNYDVETIEDAVANRVCNFLVEIAQSMGLKSACWIYGHFESQTPPKKTCPGKNLAIKLLGKLRWEKAFGKA